MPNNFFKSRVISDLGATPKFRNLSLIPLEVKMINKFDYYDFYNKLDNLIV